MYWLLTFLGTILWYRREELTEGRRKLRIEILPSFTQTLNISVPFFSLYKIVLNMKFIFRRHYNIFFKLRNSP